ncbi:hypothetical protein AKJ58_00730 [candidate division MSBL1 archaeon SCGC-AAA385D11]|uniref:Probable membrane transporter protein n=1 Tax=candidate division MSBL1 archaeon SCGC-AAA385D11 TaxID=1698286 RepID=A0A133VP03_9EURY|nr:hypothetical protein AKJ58_00730 [candidate division MSBL1 archaeon SCGC-AAA385D11]
MDNMEIIFSLIILAFLFDFMNCAAGMGLGTSLAPILFLLGYTPLQVVPVLLIAATVSGWVSGFFHHEFENVNFSFRPPLSKAAKVTLLIAGVGCIGIFFSVMLAYFLIKFPEVLIKTYVAVLVLFMGFIGLMSLKDIGDRKYRPKMLAGFAGLAGFNKGIGGGGYGPVVVMGEIFSGIYEKSAVGIVSLAEGIVSTVGVLTFFIIMAEGVAVDLWLLPSIFTGTFISSLIAPYMVRVFPNKVWRIIIPAYAFSIGAVFLMKIFLL